MKRMERVKERRTLLAMGAAVAVVLAVGTTVTTQQSPETANGTVGQPREQVVVAERERCSQLDPERSVAPRHEGEGIGVENRVMLARESCSGPSKSAPAERRVESSATPKARSMDQARVVSASATHPNAWTSAPRSRSNSKMSTKRGNDGLFER
jgi:hypothetical protein